MIIACFSYRSCSKFFSDPSTFGIKPLWAPYLKVSRLNWGTNVARPWKLRKSNVSKSKICVARSCAHRLNIKRLKIYTQLVLIKCLLAISRESEYFITPISAKNTLLTYLSEVSQLVRKFKTLICFNKFYINFQYCKGPFSRILLFFICGTSFNRNLHGIYFRVDLVSFPVYQSSSKKSDLRLSVSVAA